MDTEGFRRMLQARKLPADKIEASLALAERFDQFLRGSDGQPARQTTLAFSDLLILEGQNTQDNYFALARYGRFLKNDDVYVAVLDLVDGAEALPNLRRRVGQTFGQDIQDEVFAGIDDVPLGLPSPEKPRVMHTAVERLEARVGKVQCARLLSACLRDLPDEYYRGERRKYLKAKDIDDFLRKRHQAFVRQLKKLQRQGQLFYTQEITGAVVAMVQGDPEIENGRREGNLLYVSKIPYMAKHYLAESDPTLKRYYACHCPWVREAIKTGDVRLARTFCYCSGGYSKKPWEVIFRRPLEVELLESALQGDLRCRFVIRLPDEAIPVGE